MPCDTKLKAGQTIQQRAEEVRQAVQRLEKALIAGKAIPKIGPQGAITFSGLTDADRDGVTDNCLYRRLQAAGSPLAKAKITLAEHMAGRTVNRQAVAQGHHSHDGGKTWHKH